MDTIFHERQEGSLCAQHALNALLQDSYYTADVLADLAKEIDAIEHNRIAEAYGRDSEYYRTSTAESQHYDDSGFFSLEVIAKALSNFNLNLVPWGSENPAAVVARNEPAEQNAYICNYRLHWLTIRKFGTRWFNLNSMLQRPEPISDTYLSLFLAQLMKEKFHIFIVVGDLPLSEADRYFIEHPDIQLTTERGTAGPGSSKPGNSADDDDEEEDAEFQLAMRESRILNENDDEALQSVLRTSREESGAANVQHDTTDDDELQQAIRLSLEETSKTKEKETPAAHANPDPNKPSCSTSNVTATSTKRDSPQSSVDLDEVRNKRLRALERNAEVQNGSEKKQ